MKEFPQSISGPEGLEGQIVEVKDIIPGALGDFTSVKEIREGNLRHIKLTKEEINSSRTKDRLLFEHTQNIGLPAPAAFLGDFLATQNKEILFTINGPFSGLKDKIVVDFGAGQLPNGYLIAREVEARAYIGVEPFYTDRLLKSLEKDALESYVESYYSSVITNKENIPRTVSDWDILNFLKNIPENSVSFLIFGQAANREIISNKDSKEIEDEIYRTVGLKDVVVCDSTLFVPKNALTLDRIDIYPDCINILRKKS